MAVAAVQAHLSLAAPQATESLFATEHPVIKAQVPVDVDPVAAVKTQIPSVP